MSMRPQWQRRILCCAIFLAAVATAPAWSAQEPAQGKTALFFSQGQAIYHPQDRARSQQDAIQDFLLQAVTQALGNLLSSSQMGSRFGPVQEKILKHPERYVVTYQLFSESPAGGLYRVTGQVTVAMDNLRRDLMQMGLGAGSYGERQEPASLPDQPSRTASTSETVRNSGEPRQATRGIVPSGQELYWAVAESWGEDWHIPKGPRDPRGLFASSVLQECRDYTWSVRLPEAGALTPDVRGNVPLNSVLAQAGRLGLARAVVGTVALRKSGNQNPRIEAALRVVDVPSGRVQGEIRKQWTLHGDSIQEGALELASLIIPQLDQFMGEFGKRTPAADRRFIEPQPASPSAPPVTEPSPSETMGRQAPSQAPPIPQEAPPSTPSPPQPPPTIRGSGEITLAIKAPHSYAHWEELEKYLREHCKSARVISVTMGPDGTRVRMDGVDGRFLETLGETRLKDDLTVRVEGYSPDSRTLTISFSHSE
ncbi:MAG: hypothetical protein KBH99_06365 [Syntrophobacteraceae bacterium]|nr:hypothetical protein [Syntrophobacteraceae bacterium]